MEVNSCLTMLPSDVFSRELGKQTAAQEMQAEDCAERHSSSIHSDRIRIGRSIAHQFHAMTCCSNISWNVLGENVPFACARLCSFLLFISIWWIVLTALSWPDKTHVLHLKEEKQQKFSRKCVYFNKHVIFMSFCLPKLVKSDLSLKLINLKVRNHIFKILTWLRLCKALRRCWILKSCKTTEF